MTVPDIVGYLGAAFVIATYSMKTMIPLRSVGLISNAILLAYASLEGAAPEIILEGIVLPLNGLRLYQMVKLTRRVESAARGDGSMDWLKPFMHRHRTSGGDVLFHKGDPADAMYYIVSGHYRLRETGIELPVGEVVGELGLLAPDQRRTQTLECVRDGELLVITYDRVKQLYFQNPSFGFFFLRLATQRLFHNQGLLEAKVAETGTRAARAQRRQRIAPSPANASTTMPSPPGSGAAIAGTP